MPDTVTDPRAPEPKEFSALLDFCDRSFNREQGGVVGRFRHCYDADHLDRHAIISQDGNIVSHAAAIPLTLVVDGAELEIWGISGAITDLRYQDREYTTQLIEFWLDRIAEEDVALSTHGIGFRPYETFDWEQAGRQRTYQLRNTSFTDGVCNDSYVRVFDGSDAEIEHVRRLYESRRYRVGRDRSDFDVLLNRLHVETLLYTDPDDEAYLSFTRGESPTETLDMGGSPKGIRALLEHVFRVYRISELHCHLHPTDPLNAVFVDADLNDRWQDRPNITVNLHDLPRMLSAFETQMSQRWDAQGQGGSVTIGIEGDTSAAEVAWRDGEVSVTRVDADPELSFDRREMTRLCFDRSETVAGYDGHPLLDVVFPLDFHIPLLDNV
jgi:hypothetical protein